MKDSKRIKRISILSLIMIWTLGLVGCGSGSSGMDRSKMVYDITPEANQEVMMENRPEAPFWFPDTLLEWEPSKDTDLAYNRGTVPLKERVSKDALTPINDSQNTDVKLVALQIMNATTSGNPSHGINRFNSHTFSYWQYVDQLVYWGGSSGEGIIVPPSADVIDASHKNGVPVLGTIFFPPEVYGGKVEWLDTFLLADADGGFPMADKLIEVCEVYGFDGWFINQETIGTDEAPVTPEHAQKMQDFILYFKANAPDHLDIMWYDAMTKDGKMRWQNALTDENDFFMVTDSGEPVSDSMFLNFWWTVDQLADRDLLRKSQKHAVENGIDPYDLYAGIDLQANGIATPIKWNLFEDNQGKPYTSIGLYCPSWTYFSASNIDDFHLNENLLWVNPLGDPRLSQASNSEISWPGISTYVVERSPVVEVPFITHFNTGNGYNFFTAGEMISNMSWNNRSFSDVFPTYRWVIEDGEGNQLSPYIDYAKAYYGGSSIRFRGKMNEGVSSEVLLFASDIHVEKGYKVELMTQSTLDTEMTLILSFADGTKAQLLSDQVSQQTWSKHTFDLKAYEGKNIRQMALSFETIEVSGVNDIYLGRFAVLNDEKINTSEVREAKVDGVAFDDESMFAGVRMSWTGSEEANHYEVYKKNEDGSYRFLGATRHEAFFINALERDGDHLENTLVVFGVHQDGTLGQPASATLEWPDNSLPRAGFTASKTIVAPGESVTFFNASSLNTETVKWTFKGADIDTSNEFEPTVSFLQEGQFTVTLTAYNSKGESTYEREDFILVSAEVDGELNNLSHQKPVEASSYIHAGEQPAFALNGSVDTKWCAVGPPPHHMTIDLEEVMTISEVYIAHAEAGGESPMMNTERYTIEVSIDGQNFEEVVNVRNNSLGITVDTFKAVEARYVRLNVIKPTQTSDSAARIYEVRVRGLGEAADDEEALAAQLPTHADTLPIVSLGKSATASSYVNDNEGPHFALDGLNYTKWCAVGDAPHEITLDLEDIYAVGEIFIGHAGHGGEDAEMNTQAYTLALSEDGETFTEVLSVSDHTENTSVHRFEAQQARYVRLTIVKPTQTDDTAARIYEIRVGAEEE